MSSRDETRTDPIDRDRLERIISGEEDEPDEPRDDTVQDDIDRDALEESIERDRPRRVRSEPRDDTVRDDIDREALEDAIESSEEQPESDEPQDDTVRDPIDRDRLERAVREGRDAFQTEGLAGLESDIDRQDELDESVRVQTGGEEVRVSEFVQQQARAFEDAGLQRDEFAIVFDESSGEFNVQFDEDRTRRRREDEAIRAIQEQLHADIGESDVRFANGTAELTAEARQRIAFEQLDEQIQDRDLSMDEVEFDNGSVSLSPETERELAAKRLDERFEDVAIGPDDLERTDDGFSVQIEQEQDRASQRLRDWFVDIRDDGILVDDPLDVRPTTTEFEVVRPELFRSPAEIQAGTRDLSREVLETRIRGEAEVGRAVEQRIEDGNVTRDEAVLAGAAVATRVNPAARAAAVATAAAGITQIDEPEVTTPAEVEMSEEVVSTTRVGVGSATQDVSEAQAPDTAGNVNVAEIEAPEGAEPVSDSEIGVPDPTEDSDPTEIRVSEAITPTVPGTDLPSPTEPSLPDVTGPSVTRDQAIERTFPTGAGAVIGRSIEQIDEQIEASATTVTESDGEFVTPTEPTTPPGVREIGVPGIGIDDSIQQGTNALNLNIERLETATDQRTTGQAVATPTVTAISTIVPTAMSEPTVPGQQFDFAFDFATPTFQFKAPRIPVPQRINIPEFDFGTQDSSRRRRDRETFERTFEIDVPDPLSGVTGEQMTVPGSNVPTGGMGE